MDELLGAIVADLTLHQHSVENTAQDIHTRLRQSFPDLRLTDVASVLIDNKTTFIVQSDGKYNDYYMRWRLTEYTREDREIHLFLDFRSSRRVNINIPVAVSGKITMNKRIKSHVYMYESEEKRADNSDRRDELKEKLIDDITGVIGSSPNIVCFVVTQNFDVYSAIEQLKGSYLGVDISQCEDLESTNLLLLLACL